MKLFGKLFLALLLAMALGCGSDSPDTGNTGVENPGQVNPGETPVTETFKATLVASVPNGITGDFVLNGDVVCSQVTTCNTEVTKADNFAFEFECPTHLFVTQKVNLTKSDDGKTVNVNWEAEGAWGLAPNGWYVDKWGDLVEVKTGFNDGEIAINTGLGMLATVKGHAFYGETDLGTLEGTISDDLKVISYVVKATNGNVDEGDLTLQE